MVKRSIEHANYSLHRLRDWVIIVALAATGVTAGACGVAAAMTLFGALGSGAPDATWQVEGAADTIAAAAVLAAAAVIVFAVMVWLSDRAAPLMVRSNEQDRMHSRWGLRMTAVTSAALPFVVGCVGVLLMALGVQFN